MNLAQISGALGLEIMNLLFAGATLTMYSGTQPASPETALSGNTALVTFAFASPAFGEPAYSSGKMTAVGSLVTASVSPTTSGTVSFARATLATAAWAASHAYAYGALVTSGSNVYLCLGNGTSGTTGPTSTAAGAITDGTVTWVYIGPTSSTVTADYTCGITSGTFDIVLGSTTITVGVQVDITSFTQSIPVV